MFRILLRIPLLSARGAGVDGPIVRLEGRPLPSKNIDGHTHSVPGHELVAKMLMLMAPRRTPVVSFHGLLRTAGAAGRTRQQCQSDPSSPSGPSHDYSSKYEYDIECRDWLLLQSSDRHQDAE